MTAGKDQVRFSQSEISVAGLGAGEKNNCVPLKDGRDIAAPKIAGGGADRTIGFAPSKLDVGGDCTCFLASPDTTRSCSASWLWSR